MSNKMVEQLANDFLQLIPLIKKNVIKPFEQNSKALSPMQIHLLFFLKNKNSITMTELASQFKILKQQLTFLTNKLEENGFIERKHDQKDRRLIKIFITQDGLDYLSKQQKLALEMTIHKFEKLSEEDVRKLHDAILTISEIAARL